MKKNFLWLILFFLMASISVVLCVTIQLFPQYDKNGRLDAQSEFPLQWQWHLALPEKILSGGAAENNIVVVRTQEDVYAINIDTGSVLWKTNISLQPSWSDTPLIRSDKVFVGSPGEIVALELETGRILWRKASTCEFFTDPKGADDHVVVVFHFGCEIVAYDQLTGEEQWRLPSSKSDMVAVDRGRVYVGGARYLSIYRIEDGENIQRIEGVIRRPKCYQDDIVYGFTHREGLAASSSATDEQFIAYDWEKQQELWALSDQDLSTPCVVEGNELILTLTDDSLLAVDRETGKILWRSVEGYIFWQTPAVLNQVVYARQRGYGKIYAISLEDGRVLGYLSTGYRAILPSGDDIWRPIVADGKLIVPVEKDIYAYGP